MASGWLDASRLHFRAKFLSIRNSLIHWFEHVNNYVINRSPSIIQSLLIAHKPSYFITISRSSVETASNLAMPTILIIGATRGLGFELAKAYASKPDNYVLATARTSNPPANCMSSISIALFGQEYLPGMPTEGH